MRALTATMALLFFFPKPPMPNFRMTKPDAEAVLAYLKSLKQ